MYLPPLVTLTQTTGKDLNLVHTVDTPALRQTVTTISTTNTLCTIFEQDSINIKVHVVYKILALVSAIISLLDQQKKLLLSLQVGVTVFVSTVCRYVQEN